MDFENYFQEYLPVLKHYWLPTALFIVGLFFLALGLSLPDHVENYRNHYTVTV